MVEPPPIAKFAMYCRVGSFEQLIQAIKDFVNGGIALQNESVAQDEKDWEKDSDLD